MRFVTASLCLCALTLPAGAGETPISAIQGSDHFTPLPNDTPVDLGGVVTGIFGNGFFMQALMPDGDSASSDGIFVFIGSEETRIFPMPEVGDVAHLTGTPVEFKPFLELPLPRERDVVACGSLDVVTVPNEDRDKWRPITEIARVSALSIDGTADLPTPVVFDPPGATLGIARADVPNTPFNASAHPRDHYESLEHMRVVIEDAVVLSRKEPRWETFYVASRSHLGQDELTGYGFPLAQSDHVFPEILQVHRAAGQGNQPLAPGLLLGDVTGIMTYENGAYMLVLDEVFDPAALPMMEMPAPIAAAPHEGTRIASYNAENLSIAADQADARFAAIAAQIVHDLGAPDVLALQEIQDDDGETVSAEVSASQTLAALVEAIQQQGGPLYQPVAIDPAQTNTDGGAPGSNIRPVFLVNNDAGLEIGQVERLFDSDDRCDPNANSFANSRKPLLMELKIEGQPYVLVNVHLKSKIGDEGAYTLPEDPQLLTSAGRLRQVQTLVATLEQRYGNASPTIILMGDFNDHADAFTLAPLLSSALGFTFLPDERGETYTASYAFNGLREAIDHFVVGGRAHPSATATYVNINADEVDQVSDHNPVVLAIP